MAVFLEGLKMAFGLIFIMIVFVGVIRVFTKILEELGVFSLMEKIERKLILKFVAHKNAKK